jgi:hypothetical protein
MAEALEAVTALALQHNCCSAAAISRAAVNSYAQQPATSTETATAQQAVQMSKSTACSLQCKRLIQHTLHYHVVAAMCRTTRQECNADADGNTEVDV